MAQCPSCQFENLPQYQTCVRCGSILPGSNVPVGIEPPRAGKIEKTLQLAKGIRIVNRYGGAVANSLVWTWRKIAYLRTLEIRPVDLAILGMFWKGLVPGLAQWYIGRTPRDKFFFFGWLILLFLSLLTIGLTISQILLGFAIAWHLTSIIDAVIITCRERNHSDRFFCFALMVIPTVLVFYVPTSALCWRHLCYQYVTVVAGPIQKGDTLLYTMLWNTIKPQVGSIVLYQAPDVTYPSPTRRNANYRLAGIMFDRVLAVEGQTVSWQEGTLTIDGKPPPCSPLAHIPKPPDTTFVVPAGCCYVVPGPAFGTLEVPSEEYHWQRMGLVPNSSVYGVVWGARRSLFQFVDLNPK